MKSARAKKIVSKGLHSVGSGMRHLMMGDAVSSDFFISNFFVTGAVVIAAIMIIALRFQCVICENTIDSLNNKIHVMDTYKQKERSRYMTLTRESAMIHLVDSLHLGLSTPDRRPNIVVVPPLND